MLIYRAFLEKIGRKNEISYGYFCELEGDRERSGAPKSPGPASL